MRAVLIFGTGNEEQTITREATNSEMIICAFSSLHYDKIWSRTCFANPVLIR